MNSQSPFLRPSLRQRGFINKPFLGAVAILAGLVAFGTSFLAIGAGSPVTTPPINLSSDPLYAVNVKDKPTMALALSVEFPTVGAQYVNVPNTNTDDSYANTKEYLGYYDAESCYRYNDAPTETPESGRTAADYKRFDPVGRATNRKCSDAFSGNFLNWATNSAVDMLRLALSGGDRYVDTSTLTILQRAVLPNGDPICMWNSNNFPAKRLAKDGGGANSYWGAVPNSMVADANGNDIWVANTLNRVYFRAGASAAGSCTDSSGYTLGTPTTTQSRGTTTTQNNVALPPEAVLCTPENSMCNFTGVREVWFGVPPTRLTPRGNWAIVPASNGINCNYQVIGDPAPGQSKSCYTRPYPSTGTWQPPQTTALNSDGFFYSRVQVCNKTGDLLQDIRDYGLCTQYPSGNYKPVGVIQKYSDQLRLAAFGYLMDQTASYNNGRYGGVLRAPMKYVGQKTFDVLGREETATNAKAEWNINTGIFNKNPESDTVFGISGVINYLNQFGRTGPVPGRYKQYDPVGELYYQSLRYMQGLSPTADAISGLGTPSTGSALYDGYPVYTDWTNIDPYGGSRSSSENYSCVRSNIVVIGDINTHDGNWRNIPTSDDPANNATNFRTWHQVVQSFEKGISTAYVDGQGVNRTTSNPNTANPNVPANSQTSQIMGYAYWAHTQDIRGTRWTAATAKQRPGLRVKTFLFDVNEYATQNDTVTRQTRNQFFMAAKYGGFTSTSPDPTNSDVPFNSYGNPFRSQARNADNPDNNVWQKPSAAGEASTYYLQSDARGVLAAFQAIFESASGGARSIAGSASLSTIQANTENFLYSAKFDVASWTGDVIAEQITRVDDGTSARLVVATNPTWSAAARLKAKNAADRKIYAGHGSRQAATEFTWTGINSKPMQASLSKASPSATADSLGPDRLDYLRGGRSNEGTGARFRVRTELLGDIVNSGVTFSGPPATAFTGNSYTLFRGDNGTRSPVVFAGANDGMLHAFAVQTDTSKGITAGDELFAYIPSWMGPKLSALTSPTYVNNHQAYVDAPSAVGEAQVAFTSGAGDATDWKTVLVSGTGAGGRGVFALDVSKPESFAAGNAMWEFTGADDADMGFVVGRPQILKFRTGADTYRWFAVVASGADNYTSTFDNGGGGGRPALFLLALDKATGAAWVEGTNYFKLIFPVDTALAATVATGMANFTPLYARGGEVTQIYAGDLHGKVWKLDFTCTKASADDTSCTYGYKATSNWTVAGLSSFSSGGTPYPFFIAKDASGNTQPITSAPQLFTGPIVNGQETFYVVIGTGKYLESSDRTSTRTQSVYSLYDDGSPTLDSSTPASAISGRGRMAAGTVNTSTRTVSVAGFKWGRPASDSDTTQRAGWYIDLPSSGERSISGFTDLGGLNVAFSTVVPGDVGAAGSCSTNPGSGRQYTIDVGAGNGSTADSQVGLLSAFVVVEDTASSSVTNYDSTGQAVRTIMKRSLQTGSSGVTEGKSTTVQEVVGRLSWRQIYDYRQLRKDATTP